MSAMSFVKIGIPLWLRAIGVAVLLAVVIAPLADAGLLTQYDPNSQSGSIEGITPVDECGVAINGFFTAKLEYAVYHESAPALGLSCPGGYIYAYQLFNSDDSFFYLETLSIGLRRQESVTSVGYVDPEGGSCLPDSSGSVNANGVMWLFSGDNMVYNGGQSAIMYFTSMSAPGRASAAVVGGIGADVPESIGPFSPAPEPATGGMLAIGAMSLLFAGFVRRVRGRRSVG